LTSETAPPPRNPRLQMCVEEYLFNEYALQGDTIKASIIKAKSLDISYLPSKHQSAMKESFQSAEKTFGLIENIKSTDMALQAYIPEYRPQHVVVRDIQRDGRKIDRKIKAIELKIRDRRRENENDSSIAGLEEKIESLKAEKIKVLATVPTTWKDARKRFVDLSKADKKARMTYRRNVDNAYEPLPSLRKMIADTDKLAALEEKLKSVDEMINLPQMEAMQAIKTVEAAFGTVAGSGSIKSKVSKARRALKGNKHNPEKARKTLASGLEIFAKEVAWRSKARDLLLAGLIEYNDAIKGTIGLRSQERLTDDQAGEIASCLSVHRDISLNF